MNDTVKVTVRKYSASRWSFTTENEEGASFTMTSFPTQARALAEATRRLAAETVITVVSQIWDAGAEDYRTVKQFTFIKE